MTSMEKVIVKSLPDEDSMTITLTVSGRVRNLDRPKDELVGRCLTRLKLNVAPKPGKKHKGGAAAASSATGPEVVLYQGSSRNSGIVGGDIPNQEAWLHGRLLQVGNHRFLIEVNPPIADKVEVYGNPLVGVPLLATVQAHFTDEAACQWCWSRRVQSKPSSPTGKHTPASSRATKPGTDSSDRLWQDTGCYEPRYTPSEADLGHCLRVEFTPGAFSRTGGAVSSGRSENGAPEVWLGEPVAFETWAVEEGPRPRAAEGRHALTRHRTAPGQLRVVTYNVLADQYAGSDYARSHLFAYCPLRYLAPQYRRPLIVQELLGFNADVICLQEVDAPAFDRFFLPHMRYAGFDGHYTNKSGTTKEGAAVFWRSDRFAVAAVHDLSMREVFRPMIDFARASSSAAHPADSGAAPPAATAFREHGAGSARAPGPLESHNGRGTAGAGSRADSSADADADGSSAGGEAPGRLPDDWTAALAERLQPFVRMLRSSPALADALLRVGTIAQLVILTPVDHAAANTPMHPSAAGSSIGCLPQQQRPQQLLQPGQHQQQQQQRQRTEGALCIVNTHLFFHPQASHIRTMHVAAMMHAGELAAMEWASRAGDRPAVLFCGDLNSDMNDGVSGAVELLRSGRLAADHWDWACGAGFSFHANIDEMREELGAAAAAAVGGSGTDGSETGGGPAVQDGGVEGNAAAPAGGAAVALGVEVRLPFALQAADGLRTPFTNYVRGYKGLLDYVWHDPARLRVAREIPLPQEAELRGFIPSERFPSDHLSVVFDLEWLSAGSDAAGAPPAAAARDGASDEQTGPCGMVLPAQLDNAAAGVRVLRSHGIVAVPTDTLYGLAASADSAAGMQRIYAMKRRRLSVPLPICVADPHDVGRFADTSHLPQGLVAALLPGPVTLVLRRRPDAPLARDLNPGTATIGIRCPDAPFIRHLCRELGGAIALTSANISGMASSVDVAEFRELWQECGVVFDAGRLKAGRAGSTILDLCEAEQAAGDQRCRSYRVLREGAGLAEVEALLAERYGLRRESG